MDSTGTGTSLAPALLPLFDRLALVQEEHDQCLLHFTRQEAERPAAALVGHPAFAVDDVKAIRHAAVGMADPVVLLATAMFHGRQAVVVGVRRGARSIVFVADRATCNVLTSQSV